LRIISAIKSFYFSLELYILQSCAFVFKWAITFLCGNVPNFTLSPSISLEFLELLSDEKQENHSQLLENFQILLSPIESQFNLLNFHRIKRNSIFTIFRYDSDDAEPDHIYVEIFNYKNFIINKT
jgi:hypothetical protein